MWTFGWGFSHCSVLKTPSSIPIRNSVSSLSLSLSLFFLSYSFLFSFRGPTLGFPERNVESAIRELLHEARKKVHVPGRRQLKLLRTLFGPHLLISFSSLEVETIDFLLWAISVSSTSNQFVCDFSTGNLFTVHIPFSLYILLAPSFHSLRSRWVPFPLYTSPPSQLD